MVRKRVPTAGLRRDGAGENLASVDGLPWPLYGRHKAQLRGAVTPQGRSFSKSHHIDFHGALNGHTETAIEGPTRLDLSLVRLPAGRALRRPSRPSMDRIPHSRAEADSRRVGPLMAGSVCPLRAPWKSM